MFIQSKIYCARRNHDCFIIIARTKRGIFSFEHRGAYVTTFL